MTDTSIMSMTCLIGRLTALCEIVLGYGPTWLSNASRMPLYTRDAFPRMASRVREQRAYGGLWRSYESLLDDLLATDATVKLFENWPSHMSVYDQGPWWAGYVHQVRLIEEKAGKRTMPVGKPQFADEAPVAYHLGRLAGLEHHVLENGPAQNHKPACSPNQVIFELGRSMREIRQATPKTRNAYMAALMDIFRNLPAETSTWNPSRLELGQWWWAGFHGQHLLLDKMADELRNPRLRNHGTYAPAR